MRPLGFPTVGDRVAQTVVKMVRKDTRRPVWTKGLSTRCHPSPPQFGHVPHTGRGSVQEVALLSNP